MGVNGGSQRGMVQAAMGRRAHVRASPVDSDHRHHNIDYRTAIMLSSTQLRILY